MTEARMQVCLGENIWYVCLNPSGTTVGRDEGCDIVVSSPHVSRRHARIWSSAEGHWLVEDLGSSNGTLVNGERVQSGEIFPADVIDIGPASLSFSPLNEQPMVSADVSPNIIIEDFGTEVFYDKPRLAECERIPFEKRLNQVKKGLSLLGDQANLYRRLCQYLADKPQTAAAVFRFSFNDPSGMVAPSTLAYHIGVLENPPGTEWCQNHLAFRVSHRLLESVRQRRCPLMSKSIFSCDTQVTLSVINEFSPRALICVPVGHTEKVIDLLYTDVPIVEHQSPCAEEAFVFIQALAKMVAHENES
jgi:hypothetical protein